MASTAKLDLIEGAGLTERAGVIVEAIRYAYVSGLTAGSSTLKDALAAPTMPPAGDPHPDIPTIFLHERVPEPYGGSTTARVKLVYKSPDVVGNPPEPTPQDGQWLITGGTGLVSKRFNRDRDGNLITLTYAPPLSPGEMGPVLPIDQTGEIDVPLPQSSLVFESIVTTTAPGALTQLYVGKTNQQAWQGGAPDTWLCVDGTFKAVELPDRWMMHFEFQYNPKQHHFEVWWIDPETGKAPADVFPGVGTKSIVWYDWIPFAPFFPA